MNYESNHYLTVRSVWPSCKTHHCPIQTVSITTMGLPSYCTSRWRVFNKSSNGSTMLGFAVFTMGWTKTYSNNVCGTYYVLATTPVHILYVPTRKFRPYLPGRHVASVLPSVVPWVNYSATRRWDPCTLAPRTWGCRVPGSVASSGRILASPPTSSWPNIQQLLGYLYEASISKLP